MVSNFQYNLDLGQCFPSCNEKKTQCESESMMKSVHQYYMVFLLQHWQYVPCCPQSRAIRQDIIVATVLHECALFLPWVRRYWRPYFDSLIWSYGYGLLHQQLRWIFSDDRKFSVRWRPVEQGDLCSRDADERGSKMRGWMQGKYMHVLTYLPSWWWCPSLRATALHYVVDGAVLLFVSSLGLTGDW